MIRIQYMSMTRIYVPLPAEIREALLVVARQELRRPQDQAAVLIIDALRESGALAHLQDTALPATPLSEVR